MTALADYQDKYEFIKLRREDGILEIRIHQRGGPAKWNYHPGGLHDELGDCFYHVGRDPQNRIVIITGTGDVFLTESDLSVPDPLMGTPAFWYRIWKEGKDLLENLLNIECPVIGAVNGDAFVHSELPTMSDIVICSDRASFADKAHVPSGTAAGDGVHVWWQMLLGPNRGRHFLLTGTEIPALQALELGVVAEVVPHAEVNARAWEVARQLSKTNDYALRYTRAACVQHIRRRMMDDLGHGLMLEGMGVLARVAGQGK